MTGSRKPSTNNDSPQSAVNYVQWLEHSHKRKHSNRTRSRSIAMFTFPRKGPSFLERTVLFGET